MLVEMSITEVKKASKKIYTFGTKLNIGLLNTKEQ